MKLLSVMKLLITVKNRKLPTYKLKSYCLKRRKVTKIINLRVSNRSNSRKTRLSKYAICGSKKSRFIKDQEAKGLLSNLGNKTPLSKVLILGDILL